MQRSLTDYPTVPKKKRGKLYSDAKKLEAMKLWLLTGNLMHTAAALNLPFTTVRSWRYSDWWTRGIEDLKTEDQIQLSNRLKTIAEKSLAQMEDRIEKGDWVLDRVSGEMKRKPVSLRDTTQAFNAVHDRKMRLDESPKDEQNNKQVMDRLAALASKFEEIANKKNPIQVTDVIFVEGQTNGS